MISISYFVKAAKNSDTHDFSISFSYSMGKKRMFTKSDAKKRQSVSLCMKKVELITFQNICIWLDKPFEIFISDESIKEGKIHGKKLLHWLVFTLVF